MGAEIAGERWLSPVYWTLPIEIQFYLVVGLLFPLLLHKKHWVKALSFVAFLSMFYLAPYTRELLFKYATVFGTGMAIAYWKLGYMRSWMIAPLLAAMVSLIAYQKDTISAIAVGVAALFICLADIEWPPFLHWLGKASFSLYLTHCLVGGVLFFEYHRFVPAGSSNFYLEILVTFVSIAIDLGVAALFYRWIEVPCAGWAKKL